MDTNNNITVSTRKDEEEFQELVQTLPRERNWQRSDRYLHFYQGFWCQSPVLKPVISFQKHFQPVDSDIIVSTFPKCGTTWLKALIFSIVNRNHFSKEENPLLTLGPHQLVRFLELDLYFNNPSPNLENISSLNQPRLFSTHVPYASLPSSIQNSNFKIVYICRNPMDMFISLFFFLDKLGAEYKESPLSLDEAFESFCRGVYGYGPFFDHVLGYWKASQESPNKILFLQYENLKEDINFNIKKMATFLGFPFSEEEETNGVVEDIAKFCSFGNLKELDVNKNGIHPFGFPRNALFLGKQKWEIGEIISHRKW